MIQNIGIFVSCFYYYIFSNCLYHFSEVFNSSLFVYFSTDFVALAGAGWGILHEGLTAGLQSVLAFLAVVCLFGLVSHLYSLICPWVPAYNCNAVNNNFNSFGFLIYLALLPKAITSLVRDM